MILEHLDLVHFDIKHMNSVTHKELTDVPNELILDNARKTAALRPIIIRIPVIPGCNDSEENIAATARFAAELGDNFIHLELMPYHNLGSHTFSKLDRHYQRFRKNRCDVILGFALNIQGKSFPRPAIVG